MARPKKDFSPKKEQEQKSIVKAILEPRPKISITQVTNIAADAKAVLEAVRQVMLEPFPRKLPPEFTTNQVADLCEMTKSEFKSAEISIESTRGKVKSSDNYKSYTLKETIELIKLIGKLPPLPKKKQGKVIAVASYKGGVGKTTISVSLAQALTLRGLKVLFIDLDPQGSATTLFGISPEVEVQYEETIMPFIYQDEPDLMYAVQNTYWDFLDLIPASSEVLGAEYILPANASKEGYVFWDQLNQGIKPLRDIYDVIVLDTSPSLGYLTQNAMAMADGILTPCPLEALDFASLTQFYGVFTEISSLLPGYFEDKKFDFIGVIINKAKLEKDDFTTGNIIKSWIKNSFKEYLWDVIIPDSKIPKETTSQLKTIFDLSYDEVKSTAYKRFREPLDKLADQVLLELYEAWKRG
ncbi:ParA family protein [Crenothrix polyspora]|uniref:Soj protein n=1 Tax=Crenothrix polyspora TaxID=360316 RepID=A0A1R4H442_9GAMM|nr:AAA family ATPase [Crenothrix polyspora]SJM91004.1 Soj protein [Crenothrix polyspora]